MHQLTDFFHNLFNDEGWPARWHCGRWTAFHGWLYIISSILIALAYFSIPVTLYYIIRRAKDKLLFKRIFWLFLLFILACGFTHVSDAVMFWYPAYRVSATILFITAVISWMAVFALFKVIPGALALKSPATLQNIIVQRTLLLEQSNENLRNTNLELKASKRATEDLLKQKDEFLSIASHELKTPVTSLKGYTQVLAMMPAENPKQVDMLQKMDKQINKLTVLINDLLDVTKIQHGMLQYKNETFNCADTIREACREVQMVSIDHSILYSSPPPVFVAGDEERVRQVIVNLLSNAIKYSPGQAEVMVQLYTENNNMVCSVQDSGIGISAEESDKVFDKFYRITTDERHTFPGMGLGLHIAKDIITRHNGSIWFQRNQNSGTTFYFTLPLYNAPDRQ